MILNNGLKFTELLRKLLFLQFWAWHFKLASELS